MSNEFIYNDLRQLFRDIRTLGKFGLSAVSALSSVCGYLLDGGNSFATSFFMFTGMFLLVSGASALNQVQEAEHDGKISRTKYRPLPRGSVGRQLVMLYSGSSLFLGLFAISMTGSWISLLLGLLGILFYNGLYTCLKSKTTLSTPLGAVSGALPPIIGATAVPGIFPGPLIFAVLLFVWQLPHGWLVQIRDSKETSGEYFSRWADAIGTKGLERISGVWTIAFAFMTATVALFNLLDLNRLRLILYMPALLVCIPAAALLFGSTADSGRTCLRLEKFLRGGLLVLIGLICLNAISAAFI